jgi:N-acetylglucosamine-6-sulfatase
VRVLTKLFKLKFFLGFCLSLIFFIATTSIFFNLKASLATESSPNIVFILTDDLENAAVEYMPHVKSLLVDQGVSFSNYFVNISLCCPSRTTILRGQYAHNTKLFTNYYPDGSFIYLYKHGLEKSTIATWLQKENYRTVYIGKYLNGYPRRSPDNYVPPGWDEWHSPINDSGYLGYNYTLNENGKFVSYGTRHEDYNDDVYTKKAQEFITQATQDKQPFFLYLCYFAPHQPAVAAPRHQDLFHEKIAPRVPSFNETDVQDKPEYIRNLPLLSQEQKNEIDRRYQRRLRSLQAVDEGIASLIKTLQANHQLDNTYIIFTSDNGFHLGQHRLPPDKETAYEEDIHLPFYIRGPDILPGQIIDQIVGNVDLAPTFAELAGVKVPKFADGRSLVGLFRRNLPLPLSWRQMFLLEHKDSKHLTPPIPDYLGLRTANCTYVEYNNGEQELYNLTEDPYQLHNLATIVQPKIIKEYARRLMRLRNCRGKACRQLDLEPLPNCQISASSKERINIRRIIN